MSSNAIGQRPKERTARTPKAKNRTHPRLEKFVKDFLINPTPSSPPEQTPSSQQIDTKSVACESVREKNVPDNRATSNRIDFNSDSGPIASANDSSSTTTTDNTIDKDNTKSGYPIKDEANAQSSSAPTITGTATTTSNKTPARPPSPLSNQCPICLANIVTKDTSFTNTCFHSFCYSCIDEWTKIKTQCPVCRTDFTKIIYNVQSETVYDEKLARSTRRPDTLFSNRTFMDSLRFGFNAQTADYHHVAFTNSFHHYSVQHLADSLGLPEGIIQTIMDNESRSHSSSRSRNDRYSVMYAHPSASTAGPAGHSSSSSRVNASTNTPATGNSESRRRHGSRVMRMRIHPSSQGQEPRSDSTQTSRDPHLDSHNYAQMRRMARESFLLDSVSTERYLPRFRHFYARHMQLPTRPSQTQTSSPGGTTHVRRSTRSTRTRAQASQQHMCTSTDMLNNRQPSHIGDPSETGINNLLVQHSSLYTDRYDEGLFPLDPPYNQRNPIMSNQIFLSHLSESIPSDTGHRVPSSSNRPRVTVETLPYTSEGSSAGGSTSVYHMIPAAEPTFNRSSSYMHRSAEFSAPPQLEDLTINIPILPNEPPTQTAPPPPLLDHHAPASNSTDPTLSNQRINAPFQRVRPPIYSGMLPNYAGMYQETPTGTQFIAFPPDNWYLPSNLPQEPQPPNMDPPPVFRGEDHTRIHDHQSSSDRSNSRQSCPFWSGPPRIVSNRCRTNKRARTSVACRPIEFINLSGSEDEDDSNRGHNESSLNRVSTTNAISTSSVQLDNPQPSTSGTQTTNEKRHSKRRKTTSSKIGSNSRNHHSHVETNIYHHPVDEFGSRLSSPELDCDNNCNGSESQNHHVDDTIIPRRLMNDNISDDSSEVEIVNCLKPIAERDHDVIDLEDD